MAATSLTAQIVANNTLSESPTHQIVVKNTFFTLANDEDFLLVETVARRTNSAPPAGSRSEWDVVGRSLPSLLLPSGAMSDKSSDEGDGDRCSSRKTSTGSTSGEDSPGSTTSEDGEESPGSTSEEDGDDSRSEVASSDEYEDVVPILSGGRVALSLDSLVAGPTPAPRARLRSNAKVYKPSQCTNIALQLPPPTPAPLLVPIDVKREFADVVAAGQMAMKQCNCKVVAEQHDTNDEWTVALSASVETVRDQKEVLARAKASLLEAAENSKNTYIVGYETEPFVPTAGGMGFVSRLARVTDESCACWDFLTQGFCIRESACRWQHPVWQAVVCVQCDIGQ